MLGLHRTSSELDDLVARATKARLSPTQLLEHIVQLESDERARRSLEHRTLRSRLGRFKPIADFDWSWPKSIDRPLVESLLRLDFLQDARNVVLLAAQGLGKTMIAQNLAHEALRSGHSVLFTTASQLLLDLGSRDSSRALESRLRHYARVGLLIIDELGYLSYDARNADLLFQLVNLRYEKRSLVLTSQLDTKDWHAVIGEPTLADAILDRLVHNAHRLKLTGDSVRDPERNLTRSKKGAK